MPDKTVIAYYMHEAERASAGAIMGADAQYTDAFVTGRVPEARIAELQQAGLIVDVVDEGTREAQPAFRFDEEATPRPAAVPAPAAAPPGAGARAPAARAALPDRPTYFTVRVRGPMLPAWQAQLHQAGAEVVAAQGRNQYTLRLHPSALDQVRALPFLVGGPRLFEQRDAAPAMAGAAPPPPALAAGAVTWEALLQRNDDAAEVVAWLEQHRGVLSLGAQGRKLRFVTPADSDLPGELRALPEVVQVQQYVEPKLHNDRARVLLGIDAPAGGGPPLPWTGRGEIVGVADTGLDQSHPDFQGRIQAAIPLGRPGDPSDPNGHGTHVAGSILGDGSASAGSIRGAAPDARLYFQSVLDAKGGLGGLPWEMAQLFGPAYDAGVRIHNNSWGAATASEYTVNAIEVDEFVHAHPDFLVIISAGNDGSAKSPRHAQRGYTDWLSVGSPASCKNALTVGASRSDRAAGGLAPMTYHEAWPGDFPDPPIGGEPVSGAPEEIAGFSSRGPCTDRRVKPDVVAPGTDIASTRSTSAPLRNFWGAVPGHAGRYAYLGGTSMAAPLVAGCAALVRQYYRENRQHNPSAALLKATLINATRVLTGASAVADYSQLPNYHQGFGRIDMARTLPVAPNRRLEFVDSWQDPGLQFTSTGQRFRWTFDAGTADELRLCLVWTDPAARALQNNLNLFLQVPGGAKVVGNEGLPGGLTAVDTENNVEVIRLPQPAAGRYTIQVTASNLVMPEAQSFALVVAGPLTGALQQI